MRMGRVVVAVGLACLALVVTAGCQRTPGIDGVLTDQWPALAEPKVWEPKVGECHTSAAATLNKPSSGFVTCDKVHQVEFVHVGQFASAGDKPPVAGSPELKTAWTECDARVTDYLGGQWRDRKIWMGVAAPPSGAWSAGARWYACQMGAITQMKGGTIPLKTSLKGKFDADPTLLYGCLQVDKEGGWAAKDCAEAHNSEFVGTFPWDTSWEDLNKEIARENDAVHVKCVEAVGNFVGGRVRTGTYVWIPAQNDWNAGDKTIRCFFWLGADKSTDKSLRGVGAAGWPLK